MCSWEYKSLLRLPDKSEVWLCLCMPVWGQWAELCLTLEHTVPHAFCGAIMEILQQLRDAQHGLEHHGQRTQSLHKHHRVQQQQGDDCTHDGEAEAEEEVVLKGAPLPEVMQVQVYNREIETQTNIYW